MKLIYHAGIYLYKVLINLAALAGNKKAASWIEGRKNWRNKLSAFQKKAGETIWFHCSSLGEFEQGRPLIEAMRERDKDSNIILSFFSPSGYEIRKDYPHADLVCYLPLDTPFNAKDFLDIISPDAAYFIKYEYWYNYLNLLHSKKIPVYIVSGIFRESQPFFKWYGTFWRAMLRMINHFFLQDAASGRLLNSIGISSHSLSGDTRFDRVIQVNKIATAIPLLDLFCQDSMVMVCGSTWPADEKILLQLVERPDLQNLKLILAPHVVDADNIRKTLQEFMSKLISSPVCEFSKASPDTMKQSKILILDTMGQLSSVYRYAHIAYVGGGFGKGIHNILEPAVYGIPVIFGPRHEKFQEAKDLIAAGAAFCVHDEKELFLITETLVKQASFRENTGKAARQFVCSNAGATEKILEYTAKRAAGNLKTV